MSFPLALLLTIRIYDVSGVPARDLGTARHVVEETMTGSAMAVDWIACASVGPTHDRRCDEAVGPGELVIRIVRSAGVAENGDVLGYAYVDPLRGGGSLATVYIDRIRTLARAANAEPSVLLGSAIAHEIGHLLMGTTTHAAHGLMRARWSSETIGHRVDGDWLFTSHERDTMRRNLERRDTEAANN